MLFKFLPYGIEAGGIYDNSQSAYFRPFCYRMSATM